MSATPIPSPAPSASPARDPSTENLPEWYLVGVNEFRETIRTLPSLDVADVLKQSINQYEDAFDKFALQGRNAVLSLVALLSVAATLSAVALRDAREYHGPLLGVVAALLLVASAFAGNMIGVLRSCYDRYLAALLWSSQLHMAVGLTAFAWFVLVRRVAKASPEQYSDDALFFTRWRRDPDAVINRYTNVLRWLQIPCLLGMVGLVVYLVLHALGVGMPPPPPPPPV